MMKKLALASMAAMLAPCAASAADLPQRAEPPPVFAAPVPIFTWTGFYAGTHWSYSSSDRQRIRTVGNNPNTIENVALGRRAPLLNGEYDGFGKIGGGFGYNYQLTPGSGFVVGVAFDWNWTDVHKNIIYAGPPLPQNGFTTDASHYRQSLEWLGTVNGKLGYAWDRFMVYGLAGFAYGKVGYDAQFFTSPPTGFNLAYVGTSSELETGFSYGGGVEYALPPDSFLNFLSVGKWIGLRYTAVTLKAEYLRYDLGSRRVLVGSGFVPTATGSYTSTFKTEGSIVRFGFNYKFGS